jgi:hypothetical protein
VCVCVCVEREREIVCERDSKYVYVYMSVCVCGFLREKRKNLIFFCERLRSRERKEAYHPPEQTDPPPSLHHVQTDLPHSYFHNTQDSSFDVLRSRSFEISLSLSLMKQYMIDIESVSIHSIYIYIYQKLKFR